VDTQAVDDVRVKGAGELATLVPLAGPEFGPAYVASMVRTHAEALRVIDGQLLPAAKDKALTKHLAAVRHDTAEHLERLQQVQ
jgi:putative membrane protein